MILEHKKAVKSALKANAILATCGFEGVVPKQPDPNFPNDPTKAKYPARYWTFFTNSGARFSDRFGGLPNQATLTYTFHWVGSTPTQAQDLADLGVSILAGLRLVVPGYRPFPIRHVSSQETQMDETVKPPLHFIVDRFEFLTQPA